MTAISTNLPSNKYASFFRFLPVLTVVLMLSACASYDSRLNSTATQYLGTNGSIVTRNSTASVTDRESYW